MIPTTIIIIIVVITIIIIIIIIIIISQWKWQRNKQLIRENSTLTADHYPLKLNTTDSTMKKSSKLDVEHLQAPRLHMVATQLSSTPVITCDHLFILYL